MSSEQEQENARLRAALADANHLLNEWGEKLVAVGLLLGFHPDESKADIAAKVRAQNQELHALRTKQQKESHGA